MCAISWNLYFDIKSRFKSFSEMIIWPTFYKKAILNLLNLKSVVFKQLLHKINKLEPDLYP